MNRVTNGVLTAERKLALAAAVIACVTVSMAVVGARSSWQYYLTVEECQADGPSLLGKRIRVNGTIAPASLKITDGRKSAAFTLAGTGSGSGTALGVVCAGPLPDNLAEGIQVVVEGELQRPGSLQGERVLTRCASKYRSEGSGPPPGGHGSAR
jgi:cytochrome c-type biogenesis protein CcmE